MSLSKSMHSSSAGASKVLGPNSTSMYCLLTQNQNQNQNQNQKISGAQWEHRVQRADSLHH